MAALRSTPAVSFSCAVFRLRAVALAGATFDLRADSVDVDSCRSQRAHCMTTAEGDGKCEHLPAIGPGSSDRSSASLRRLSCESNERPASMPDELELPNDVTPRDDPSLRPTHRAGDDSRDAGVTSMTRRRRRGGTGGGVSLGERIASVLRFAGFLSAGVVARKMQLADRLRSRKKLKSGSALFPSRCS